MWGMATQSSARQQACAHVCWSYICCHDRQVLHQKYTPFLVNTHLFVLKTQISIKYASPLIPVRQLEAYSSPKVHTI